MSLLDSCCRDVIERGVVALLDPCQVCQLATVSREFRELATPRRTAILLARHMLRVNCRRQRLVMQQRDLFVTLECKLPQLDDRQSLQEKIIQHLQASPDGIRDLAAALQQALATVAHQTAVAPAHLVHVHQDLLRIANFMCLLAWRMHLRSRRTMRSQQFGHDDVLQDDEVVVVALDLGVELHDNHHQQPEQQPVVQQGGLEAHHMGQHADQEMQHADEDVQAWLGMNQEPHAEAVADAHQGLSNQQQQHAAAAAAMNHQSQQPSLAVDQPVLAAPTAASIHHSVAVQTEGLAPTMREVEELVSGVKGLLQPDSCILRPGRATLALLEHHLSRQLLAWNMPPPQEQEQQEVMQQ